MSSFMQFFIHKNCFELFLSAHFLFWEILKLKDGVHYVTIVTFLAHAKVVAGDAKAHAQHAKHADWFCLL